MKRCAGRVAVKTKASRPLGPNHLAIASHFVFLQITWPAAAAGGQMKGMLATVAPPWRRVSTNRWWQPASQEWCNRCPSTGRLLKMKTAAVEERCCGWRSPILEGWAVMGAQMRSREEWSSFRLVPSPENTHNTYRKYTSLVCRGTLYMTRCLSLHIQLVRLLSGQYIIVPNI